MQADIDFSLPLYKRLYGSKTRGIRLVREEILGNRPDTSTKEEKPARHPHIITM